MTNLITPYFSWLVIFVILPTLLLWAVAYKHLWKYRVAILAAVGVNLVVGIIGDYYAIMVKIWGWPTECCSLPRVAGLPTEELLFMIFGSIFIASTALVVRDIYQTHRRHS